MLVLVCLFDSGHGVSVSVVSVRSVVSDDGVSVVLVLVSVVSLCQRSWFVCVSGASVSVFSGVGVSVVMVCLCQRF